MAEQSRDRDRERDSIFNEPAFVADEANADREIDHDLPCRRCGYNLRGLDVSRPCPECGQRIGAVTGPPDPATDSELSRDQAGAVVDADAAERSREAALHSIHNELAIFPTDGSQPRLIDRDWSCSHCGVNLRGQAGGDACPKCGQVPRELPAPLDRPGYGQWLRQKIETTPTATGWTTALMIAVVGGFWGIFGALLEAHGGLIGVVVFGPLAEEVMKIALVVVVIETRPFRFTRPGQVFLAAAGSALGFAAIENVLYLTVYIPDPTPVLVAWRWGICSALHLGCTLIAALGAARLWRQTVGELRPPKVAAALPAVVIAAVVHGSYNALVYLLDKVDGSF